HENDFLLEAKGEPVAAGQSVTFLDKDRELPARVNPAGPVEVEQEFSWSTAPIRRIDDIRLGIHSHPTAHLPLKAGLNFAGGEGPSHPNPPPAPMAPPPMAPAPSPMGDSSTAAQGPPPVTKYNNFDRLRYLHVTEQCRHVPFGM